MAPGALAYTWLGYAGREAAAGNVAAIRYGLLALGLLAAIALLPRLVRRLRGEAPSQWIAAHELAGSLHEAGRIAVVDVRGPVEFAGPLGHIREARNIPVGELPQRLHELGPLKSKRVVLVCHTDKRSAKAASILSEAGFPDVLVLRGGMLRWNETGLPVADRLGEHRT
jgi:rhodanese-related sulfurtransferase